MAIVVQKYGGSSVADVEKLGGVADKIVATRAQGHDVVVVVSAMGKTTDELLSLAHRVDEDPPRRELDMLVTTGERISMALLSMAVQKRGAEAISFTGSQSGIITNDRHFDARIIEVRPHRVEDELARGRVVICAGYQGMSYKREITTLGRGGSDTTALAMAAALGADRAEIYSDVDGVYTADPRTVPEARHLPELTHDEMFSMADAGAQVLHARAVELARKAGIRIHARATFRPGRETVIHAGESEQGRRAVVAGKPVARVRVGADAGAVRAALAAVEEAGLSARHTEIGRDGADFLVDLENAPDWREARARVIAAGAGAARVDEGLRCVSVVGDVTPLDVIGVLAEAGVEPARVSEAPLRVTALVADEAAGAAVGALHHALVVAPRTD